MHARLLRRLTSLKWTSAGEDPPEGAVRMVNRLDINGYATGTLQIFLEGDWGAVCSSGFDDQDAQVACRQLGFAAGLKMRSPRNSLTAPPEPVISQT